MAVRLHDQLSELMTSRRAGLVSEQEYASAKAEINEEMEQERKRKAVRAHDSIISGVDGGECTEDVFPLPFPVKAGAASRREVEEQEYYNSEMWEVYKVRHKAPLSERKDEVLRRWGLRNQIDVAHEDVKNAMKYSQTAARRGGKSVNTPHTRTAALRFSLEDMNDLLGRLKDLTKRAQREHDQVMTNVQSILPAQLLGKPGMFDKKPHLYKMLRTSEVASIDSHRLQTLGEELSLLKYLIKKVSGCMEAQGGVPAARPAPLQQSTPLTSLPPVMMAWKKFAKSASNEFKESELRLVSEDTLETLLDHFGKHLTSTEQYWVTLQLRIFQGKATAKDAQHTPTAAKTSTTKQMLSVQRELEAQRDAIYLEEAKEQALRDLRETYAQTVDALLVENILLIEERNHADANMIDDLVHHVHHECNEALMSERRDMQQHVTDAVVANGELKREMEAKMDSMQKIMEEKVAIAELATKNEMNKAFQSEFTEVKRLREYYESQVQELKSKMELCNTQNSRLTTELSSSYGKRGIEDIKKKTRVEVSEHYTPLIEASDREIRTLSEANSALEAKVVAQTRALSEARASNVATEQLYRECLAEVRESVQLAGQRNCLMNRLDDAFCRVKELSDAGSTAPTPAGSPPRPVVSPPIPIIKILDSPPVERPIPAPSPMIRHAISLAPLSDPMLISPSRPPSEMR